MDAQIQAAVIGAAASIIPAAVAWFGGEKRGHRRGQNTFIRAVHEAAQQVIESYRGMLKDMQQDLQDCREKHRECDQKTENLQAQIDALMAQGGPTPLYRPDRLRGGAPE